MQSVNFDLSGKVALLTGAGRGLGLGTAMGLAKHGAAVAIQDIDLAVATEAADKLVAEGVRAIPLGGDITNLSICPGLVEQTVARLGGIHILINNAAIQTRQHWTEIQPEQAIHTWTANLLAPLRLCQLAYPHFQKQKWGRIINLSSVQSRHRNGHMLTYAMSKAALEYLTRALARDLGPDGITINAIAPGWMDTYRNRNDWPDEMTKAENGKRIPVGRVGRFDDTAGAAVFLASDAGSYITGETLFVTGGM
jgi:NAD(P)-dependent dehydrogenase (short-subunit alcohol dehydrogenase family)